MVGRDARDRKHAAADASLHGRRVGDGQYLYHPDGRFLRKGRFYRSTGFAARPGPDPGEKPDRHPADGLSAWRLQHASDGNRDHRDPVKGPENRSVPAGQSLNI